MKRSLYILLFLTVLAASKAAFSLECPEGSQLVRKEDTGAEEVFYCKCFPGRVLIGDRCKQCDLTDQTNLIEQHKAAVEGMKASLESLSFEKNQVYQTEMLEDLHNTKFKLLQAAMALAASPDPVKLPTASALFLAEVASYLSRVDTAIRKSPDIATAVSNIKNFEKIAASKAEAIKTCLTTVQKL